MNNIIFYTETSFDTFEKRDFGSVDSLILSWFSYLHIPEIFLNDIHTDGIRIADLFLAEYFDNIFSDVWSYDDNRRLFTALAASPRFRDIRITNYTEQLDPAAEKQFAAMTFKLTPDSYYIAFRGTDLTFVGWKEDFNMTFKYPVPAQEAAAAYLTEAADLCPGKIFIGGHSKGGNLSVYAAMKAGIDIQNRISKVYSHDGPGFMEEALASEEFLRIAPKIEKTIPQSSIVGILLENQESYQIVKSNSISFGQHNLFSWIVVDNAFVNIGKLTSGAKHLNHTVNDWLSGLTTDERERFVEALYSILQAAEVTSVNDFRFDWQKNLPAVMHAIGKLDGDTKHFLLSTLKELAALSAKNVPYIFKDYNNDIM